MMSPVVIIAGLVFFEELILRTDRFFITSRVHGRKHLIHDLDKKD